MKRNDTLKYPRVSSAGMPKVLILGSGAREHALSWKLSQEPGVDIEWERGQESHLPHLVARSAMLRGIDLCVVGPEAPLVQGIVDRFMEHGVPIFGPTQPAARLEGSKLFAKQFMARHGIPTASCSFSSFPKEIRAQAESLLAQTGGVVLKADGLAAGKGVFVCHHQGEVEQAIGKMFADPVLTKAAGQILVEECLEGTEVSYMVLSDGERFLPLPSAKDYKRLGENNAGPNTGGMGAYAPTSLLTPDLEQRVQQEIVQPVLRGMAEEWMPYRGLLYAGLMLTADGPKVLEFNCRFGDPETQVQLPLLVSALYPLLYACAEGSLEGMPLHIASQCAVGVVLASRGYPGTYETGKRITGMEEVEGALVFQGGVRPQEGRWVTAGGRVMTVTACGPTRGEAVTAAYAAVEKIRFEGKCYRTDIGRNVLC